MSDFDNLMRPFANRLSNMLARGRMAAVKAGGRMQVLQLQLLDGEIKDRVEHFEPYGFTSHPRVGSAEAVAAFLDGDRSHGIVLVVADRKYRLRSLKEGEVALHDDQGQSVHLTRDGIVVEGSTLPITLRSTVKVRIEAPSLEVTGQIRDLCDSTGTTMASMRATYDAHTHHENDARGETNAATQPMSP
jgi:phage baseplate assembly protein V